MSFVDANSLADPERVRRTVLAQRHDAAQRALRAAQQGDANGVVDKKAVSEAQAELEAVTADIEAEYADDPQPDPAPAAEPPAGSQPKSGTGNK